MTSIPSVDVFGGIRVVELAGWVFAPTAGAMLADWGAEVLKIEHPAGGDGYRGLVMPGSEGAINYAMHMVNRNKKSVAIDLKSDEGRAVMLEVLANADVFLTNYLPSVLDRLGFSAEVLRAKFPRLVIARAHGYGARGDAADTPAYDATAFWARGGIEETLAPAGLPEPLPQRGAVGDRYGATHLAFGIAGALFRRERTGEGTIVDVSLLGTALWMVASDVTSALQGAFRQASPLGEPRVSLPNPLAANYACADNRWLTICCLQSDKYWEDMCSVLQLEHLVADDRFIDAGARSANSGALVALMEVAFATRPLADWHESLDTARIPWAPFQNLNELVTDPQVVANGYLGTLELETGESFPLPAGAVQFDELPANLHPAPDLGEHTDEVLLALGYEWDRIIALKLSGAVL